MSSVPRVVIRPRRARPFFARHPWVFVTSIDRVEGEPEPGAEVQVVSQEGQPIARGLYNPHSAIRVRLYRWDSGPLDHAFWSSRIENAVRLRRQTLDLISPGTACRLVYSESDGLSGLTVDRYDRWLVAQFTSMALLRRSDELLAILQHATSAEGIVVRIDRGIAGQEGMEPSSGTGLGSLPTEPVVIVENDLKFEVDLSAGQKSGFYLDQRENRRAVSRYARDRRMLDLFCYSGGFSMNALRHGAASHSLGIDSSRQAIETARRNAVANQIASARFEEADVFETLDRLRAARETFGLVVCDPPKFARNPRAVPEALKGYLRLNRAAVDVLEPDGILATCTCSGLVDRGLFLDVLGQVAEQSGRPIQILEQRGQAPDHPVSASCLETEYLTCVIARVGAKLTEPGEAS